MAVINEKNPEKSGDIDNGKAGTVGGGGSLGHGTGVGWRNDVSSLRPLSGRRQMERAEAAMHTQHGPTR